MVEVEGLFLVSPFGAVISPVTSFEVLNREGITVVPVHGGTADVQAGIAGCLARQVTQRTTNSDPAAARPANLVGRQFLQSAACHLVADFG